MTRCSRSALLAAIALVPAVPAPVPAVAAAWASPPAQAAAAGNRMVDPIAGFTFTVGATSLNAPGQPLRIKTGDTMVWTNLDPIPHDVTFEGIPFAVYLKLGESAELTFTQPGRFMFQCLNHHELPSMHGLVYVE